MSTPEYPNKCPTCKAPPRQRCRATTSGRVTDTHAERIKRQFDSPRKAQIQEALASVYAKGGDGYGTMVESLADDLDKNWDRLEKKGTKNGDLQHEVHMSIWNWFPGGGTAEIAAKKVMEAVKDVRPAPGDDSGDVQRRVEA